MEFRLDHAKEILGRTPAALNSLLLDLPDEWVFANEGPGSWSPFDVVGHLVHGEETDWIPRAKIILAHGEGRAFEPFDRFAMLEKSRGRSLAELLTTFERLRGESLRELEAMNITPETLRKRGTHPELGVVTLGQLLSTWVAHDLGHVGQIVRVLAKQYGEEVGPWRDYLPVLSR
ncbi:MAG TPA: DinB family protein [Pyrinomonadaceae bacterium]|nr:DinB family protein [Pyrinomonadaceae bacterium]